MAKYNIIYGEEIGKNCSTLVSAREQAISQMKLHHYSTPIASIGITKDGKVIGHVLPTNSIFFVYQALSTPGNPLSAYGPRIWINSEGKSLTTAQADFLYMKYGPGSGGIFKPFLW